MLRCFEFTSLPKELIKQGEAKKCVIDLGTYVMEILLLEPNTIIEEHSHPEGIWELSINTETMEADFIDVGEIHPKQVNMTSLEQKKICIKGKRGAEVPNDLKKFIL